ncbi:YjbF family lipoprotein [Alteromonas gilva]|uniref:YjbF family lipoprotein n=1 Tax=Alteromonas gilva TaxID=2987522 RepID=A0ABT5L460_9ALTE|nr:YjbF family lipoprotein [Alteromonas gilva]MDC8831830.1 YjbF family lipoprotein [Alteromonas gilva]
MFPVNRFRLIVVALLLLTSLVGCSSTNQLYLETLKLAFFPDAPTLTLEQVKQSKADLLKVKHGERLPVYMGLAYIEDSQLKWVSADNAILVFHHDKLIRTSGLDSDLQYSSVLNDYTLSLANLAKQPEWRYNIDIDNQVYDLPMRSQWYVEAPESAEFYGHSLTIIPVKEVVTTQVNEPFASHSESWTNVYWFDAASKQIVYSEQKSSPYAQTLQMTFVSRIARIIDKSQGNGQ